MIMGKAKFKLSTYRLEQLLGLPYETKIIKLVWKPNDENFKAGELTIYLNDPKFPDAKSDDDTIEVFPTWNEITVRKFIDWGISL